MLPYWKPSQDIYLDIYPVSISMGVSQARWMVYFMENPNLYKWMMTGGTPITIFHATFLVLQLRRSMAQQVQKSLASAKSGTLNPPSGPSSPSSPSKRGPARRASPRTGFMATTSHWKVGEPWGTMGILDTMYTEDHL